jgi:DNA invertase Pin-like site-specific DNA recombinase
MRIIIRLITSPKGSTMEHKSFVSYLRVSTSMQQRSGLGIEAQRSAVTAHIDACGGRLIKEFIEVESGGKNDRMKLQEAISLARRSQATLVVAKLDRLARSVYFLAALLESGVDFVACDMPHANRFTVHILASVAEHERTLISQRTQVAMAEAKKRGQVFGSARPGHWDGREEDRRRGAQLGGAAAAKVHSKRANEAYRDVAPMAIRLREEGHSLRQIARVLNEEGIPTRRGRQWNASSVRNVVNRFSSTSTS